MNYEINLVDLDKDALKANLITYLKGTDVGRQYDLDTDGTAIKMLVDLFSYNSLIWMHYLHFVNKESFISTAQRSDSVSKLLEAVGFTVNNTNSALSLVTLTKTNSSLAQVDRFAVVRGRNTANSLQNFYYVDELKTLDFATTLPFYAGTNLVQEAKIKVDLQNQEYKIENESVDVRTIRVSVNSVYWSNFTNNPLQDTNENSQVFFVVKKGKYYYLKFGKDLQTENINAIGKSITGADSVLLSYVVSSGVEGNGVVVDEFVSNNTKSVPSVLISSTTSSGGYDTPDLNYLKYVGPRYYGYQGLITKSDYEAAIVASGYLSSYTDVANNIAVFDGQNHNNNYGKIYYSIIGFDVGDDEVETITTLLQSKAIFGLNVEYKASENFVGSLAISCTRDGSKTTKSIGQLRNEYEQAITDAYSTLKFNNAISKSNLITLATEVDPGLIVKDSNITITVAKTINLNESKAIYFYNPISSITTDLVASSLSASSVKFVSTSTNVPELNGFKYIDAVLSNGTTVKSKVGVFNPTTGFILFYDGVTVSEEFDLTITPNTDQITPIQNMAVSYEISSISVT
jgi:hypothetical protein